MTFKYEIDDEVEVREELTVYRSNEEGDETEVIIPQGSIGFIDSCAMHSWELFHSPMFFVIFKIDGQEVEVRFFQSDMEQCCIIRPQATGTTESA